MNEIPVTDRMTIAIMGLAQIGKHPDHFILSLEDWNSLPELASFGAQGLSYKSDSDTQRFAGYTVFQGDMVARSEVKFFKDGRMLERPIDTEEQARNV